jgi:hypothetical protein
MQAGQFVQVIEEPKLKMVASKLLATRFYSDETLAALAHL